MHIDTSLYQLKYVEMAGKLNLNHQYCNLKLKENNTPWTSTSPTLNVKNTIASLPLYATKTVTTSSKINIHQIVSIVAVTKCKTDNFDHKNKKHQGAPHTSPWAYFIVAMKAYPKPLWCIHQYRSSFHQFFHQFDGEGRGESDPNLQSYTIRCNSNDILSMDAQIIGERTNTLILILIPMVVVVIPSWNFGKLTRNE